LNFFKISWPATSAPRGQIQSATTTWRTTCQISWDVGPGTFFK